jgi:hypothetical protein
VQEEELKGAVVLIFANKQVKTIFSNIHNLDKLCQLLQLYRGQ